MLKKKKDKLNGRLAPEIQDIKTKDVSPESQARSKQIPTGPEGLQGPRPQGPPGI